MLPDRCSMAKSKRRCPNPPEFVVSVLADGSEYMVGVTCHFHKDAIAARISMLQKKESVPAGQVRFSRLKPVGTDCIRGDELVDPRYDTRKC